MIQSYNKDGVTVTVVLDRRTANKDGKYPIKVKVYHLRKPKYFSSGICMTEEWTQLKESSNLKLRGLSL